MQNAITEKYLLKIDIESLSSQENYSSFLFKWIQDILFKVYASFALVPPYVVSYSGMRTEVGGVHRMWLKAKHLFTKGWAAS